MIPTFVRRRTVPLPRVEAQRTANHLLKRVRPPHRLPVAVYAVTQLLLLAWLVAFFPGLRSFDSVNYVWQVTTGNWNSGHSVLYLALVWACLHLTGGLAALVLVQTVAMAAVLAYSAVALRDLGVRGRWSLAAAAGCAALPSTGAFTVFLWKDVPFAICGVLAFAAACRLLAVRLDGGAPSIRNAATRRQLGLLAVGTAGLMLFRNNGMLPAVGACAVLIVVLAGIRRVLLLLTLAAAALTLLLNGVVYPALGVRMVQGAQSESFLYGDIADVYGRRPADFTAADRRLMARVAPLSHWSGRGSDCWDLDRTMADPFDDDAAAANNARLEALWWRTVRKDPVEVVRVRLCRSQIGWGLLPGPARYNGQTQISLPHVKQNLFTMADWNWQGRLPRARTVLMPRPPSATARRLADSFYRSTTGLPSQIVVWRGATWCYLGYAAVAGYARRRRSWTALALAAPIAAAQLTVLAANPGQLARYMVVPLFLGILVAPLAAARPKAARPRAG
ncbi:hypothetical protein BIV57_16570 [Mangrovactinospora gilvigrisea]|uniref:Glycosyltransferase RgtA/B/C/D-like domain-containing protein n=1 Tax=Mangrovactinospora gilvigrisea TaxID=1428644 RepID=A0A1J7BCG6_9ACTN|nr:hypothetical protein [Mangrovactinospora gilvigrisea]OIV36391.1 hypothetical protein BIV57_16570 [Mangrovactinospora gilvigrisea]